MTRRLKRRAAPRSWTIPHKGSKWIQRVAPGPHAQDQSMPLVLVLRDLRGIAQSAREVRTVLRAGSIRVDNAVVRDLARGVGLMDTVSLAAPMDEHFRVVKDRAGQLVLVPIPA
ncbi:MAG: 30S ribosomal protein S4e, partial [Thermoplasmata archaeon]